MSIKIAFSPPSSGTLTAEFSELATDGVTPAVAVAASSCTVSANVSTVYIATFADSAARKVGWLTVRKAGLILGSIFVETPAPGGGVSVFDSLSMRTGGTLSALPVGLYCSREDVYMQYGQTNVEQWADLGEHVTLTAQARIDLAIAHATQFVNLELRNSGVSEIPFVDVPDEIRSIAAKLAGLYLYESRGTQEFDIDGRPQHRYTGMRKEVERLLAAMRTTQRTIPGVTTTASGPFIGVR